MRREDIFEGVLRDISGVVVEIGTCWGAWAEYLYRQTRKNDCPVLTVDPYKKYSKDEYCDAINEMSQADYDKKFEIVKNRLVHLGVGVARTTSFRVSGFLADRSISFCYLDGNHHYNAVLVDLVRWWPKIRPGGWLCGDDVDDKGKDHDDEGNVFIEHQKGSYGKYGVYQALEDFAKVCPDFKPQFCENQFYAQKPKTN